MTDTLLDFEPIRKLERDLGCSFGPFEALDFCMGALGKLENWAAQQGNAIPIEDRVNLADVIAQAKLAQKVTLYVVDQDASSAALRSHAPK